MKGLPARLSTFCLHEVQVAYDAWFLLDARIPAVIPPLLSLYVLLWRLLVEAWYL